MVDDYDRDRERRRGEGSERDRHLARRFERVRRRYDDECRTPRRGASTLGIIAFVGGLLALVVGLIPLLGAVAIFAGGLALVLAIASVLIARSSNQKMGFPVAATVVSGSAVALSLMWIAVIRSMMGDGGTAKRPAPPPLPVPPPAQVRGNANPPPKAPSENKVDEEKFQKQLLEDLAKDRIKEEIRNGPGTPVSAETLETDYLTNVVSAELRYKDKVLAVTGKVVRVIREEGKPYVLELETGEPTKTINCEFAEQKKYPLASVKRGQEVTVRGLCAGRVSDLVTLKDCVLAK